MTREKFFAMGEDMKFFSRKRKRRSAPPIRKAGAVGKQVRKPAGKPRGKSKFVLRTWLWVQTLRLLKSKWFWRITLTGTALFALIILYFASTLPSIDALETIKKQQGITIQTEDGRVISNYGDVYGTYVPYDKLPKSLVQAVIATEDRRFFSHHGVDVLGILRAMIRNARAGHVVQGGSTVTQQLAKNVFLTPDRTITRKVQEVLLALWLEHRYSKKEIMAIYLNRVYLGSGTYGVDAASHRYFNKSVTDLSLAESAMLAGLLKAPSHYSPIASMDRALGRIAQVLANMEDAGYIKESDIKPALESFKRAPAHETGGGEARYFSDWIIDQIPDYVGTTDEDLVVTTTMATTLQAAASDTIQNIISTEGPAKNISQGALVAMTPDGAVKALIGGVNYGESQYNRAVQAKRQPGSSFKLFVYLAALEGGFTPDSPVLDAPISIQVGNKTWSPNNFHQNFKGEIPMVEALRESLNTVSVRLAQAVGVSRVAEMAERLGLQDIPAHPSIALGAVEATLLDMTGAYATLPNHGNKVVPYGILSIQTRDGKELYKREEPADQQVLASSTVEMMNYMLLDVVRRGTGFKANLGGRPAAGKTGTSQDYKDAWFIGFTPQLVTGVWVGNDDNKSMKKITGGMTPSQIWHDFMMHAMDGLPVLSIPNNNTNGGLVPWLFGNNNAAPAQADMHGAVPEEVPAATGPVAPAANPATLPASPAPTNAAPQPENGGTTLTPEFWHKLMDKVPPKEKLQYTYPADNRRH